MNVLKEACVGSFLEAKKAYELGADRIELCDNLGEGGTTPSFGTIKMAIDSLNIPIFPIIRPRGGNFIYFIYNEEEVKIMEEDIEICQSLGVDGIVIGALTPDNNIDEDIIKKLVNKAEGLSITFHMAFDFIENKKAALDRLVDIGIHRVLTKGGLKSAIHNLDTLKKLNQYAGDRITILAGGGITQYNYKEIANKTGIKEVHGTKIVGDLKA
ncbi:MAG: copper homeostasis protein CutC [Clostridiales bacterium]|nr:copper homeostasis protein CutC [Clostridiales bacterium]